MPTRPRSEAVDSPSHPNASHAERWEKTKAARNIAAMTRPRLAKPAVKARSKPRARKAKA